MPLLEVRGLTKRFLGVTAVDAVDLAVDAGELVSLIVSRVTWHSGRGRRTSADGPFS